MGEIDDDGNLTIVDRKKELIISEGGKNMSPTNIESKIVSADSLIAVAVAIGDARPYNTALIMLDPEVAATVDDPRPLVQAAVDTANAELSRVEQIKKFTIVPETWEPGGPFLTPKGSLKRRSISEGYAAQINEMYGS